MVDFELITIGDKISSYEVLVVSKEHGYEGLRYNPSYNTNNCGNFGTSFLLRSSNLHNQKYFLPGEEIKIVSPPDIDYRGGAPRRMLTNTQKLPEGKNVLKVRCYPYRNKILAFQTAKITLFSNF